METRFHFRKYIGKCLSFLPILANVVPWGLSKIPISSWFFVQTQWKHCKHFKRMAARISWFTTREVLINCCPLTAACPTTITIHTYPHAAACPHSWSILTIQTYIYGAACRYPQIILSSSFDWHTARTLHCSNIFVLFSDCHVYSTRLQRF